MSQGNDFANYSAAASSGSTGAEDVWFVAVASDDIKQMNVDQLDEAFRLGVITAETAVWTEGMEAWAPLGQVADLEGGSETSGHDAGGHDANGHASAGAAHAGHHDNHPTAHDYRAANNELDARDSRRREPELREAPATLPPVGHAFGGHASNGHASNGHASNGHGNAFSSTPHSFSPGPNSISPVTSSYAPTASSGPVALNVDEDMPSIRHGRRFRPERWALGVAAVVAIGVVGYNNMFSSSVASAGTQAPVAAAAPVVSRAYSADGVEPGEKLTAKASATEQPQAAAAAPAADEASAKASEGKSSAAKSSVAAEAGDATDEAPASSKSKAGDKESLKGSFSKAFNKKASAAKATKVKPRKAAMRATTKARATKSPKKAGVAREKSAFDPLNDSLP
jgi:hypothetical protein